MPFDILKGDVPGRSFARGDWASDRVLAAAKKKAAPVIPILVGVGAAAGAVFLLSRRRGGGVVRGHVREHENFTEPTRTIPYETMHDMVHGRRR